MHLSFSQTPEAQLTRLVGEFLCDEDNLWLQPTHPLPFEEWVARYPLTRQHQLRTALSEVRLRGVTNKTAEVECFLKMETTNRQVDPRNISPRSDAFLAIVGPYVSALEHMAVDCPYLVKGLSPHERTNKLDVLRDYPNYIETDYSRWDLHMKAPFMRAVEHAIFEHVYPRDEHPDFYACIKRTLSTKGSHQLGALYTVDDGGRCSGDAHTSIGNGICDRFLTWVCLRNIPRTEWVNFHEGDDGITGVSDCAVNTARVSLDIIPCFGFTVKIVESKVLHETTFCGRVPYVISGRLREMCDLPRTLAKFHITLAQGDLKALLLAKAYSYWFTDRHTPVVGPLCYALITLLRPQVKVERLIRMCKQTCYSRFERGKILSGLHSSLEPSLPTPVARSVAEHRWDLSQGQQLHMEAEFMRWIVTGIPASNAGHVWVKEDITCDTETCTYYGNTALIM